MLFVPIVPCDEDMLIHQFFCLFLQTYLRIKFELKFIPQNHFGKKNNFRKQTIL